MNVADVWEGVSPSGRMGCLSTLKKYISFEISIVGVIPVKGVYPNVGCFVFLKLDYVQQKVIPQF